MSSDIAIKVEGLNKRYEIYDQPTDRLIQFILPRLMVKLGRKPKDFFREYWAIKQISFEVKKGETVGIVGRNGSGKSTLLQLICGTLYPTSGKIETSGRIAALLELGAGFNPEFTGRDNVYTNAALFGLSKTQVDERFEAIAAFADIGEFMQQPVKSYSSGMVVRLAFAVIAHVDADILIIDEALAVGDAFFTQKCMRFLREFMIKGTVLFVSHDTHAIRDLCNRAIWIEKGQILQEGTPKEVSELYLQAFYEAQQGAGSAIKLKLDKILETDTPAIDQRSELINNSNLRNDLQVFRFDPQSASFGKGGAQIVNVSLLNQEGKSLAWIVGGERVTVRIAVQSNKDLCSPIVGFSVKDRKGQVLFGENTYLSYFEKNFQSLCGHQFNASFTFNMPFMPAGDYSISAAVADGTQQEHEQHHWIHDAVLFKSESSSVSSGLIGIPMLDICLESA